MIYIKIQNTIYIRNSNHQIQENYAADLTVYLWFGQWYREILCRHVFRRHQSATIHLHPVFFLSSPHHWGNPWTCSDHSYKPGQEIQHITSILTAVNWHLCSLKAIYTMVCCLFFFVIFLFVVSCGKVCWLFIYFSAHTEHFRSYCTATSKCLVLNPSHLNQRDSKLQHM